MHAGVQLAAGNDTAPSLLDTLRDEIVLKVLLQTSHFNTIFGRQQAQQLCVPALVCRSFARLLRQPLSVYTSLEVDSTSSAQPSSSLASGAASVMPVASICSWSEAGRCSAVTRLNLHVRTASEARPILQLVGSGLQNLQLDFPKEARELFREAVDSCANLASLSLNLHCKSGCEDPVIPSLGSLSALYRLRSLVLWGVGLAGGPQHIGHLSNLTSMFLCLAAHCELQGLALLTKLRSLNINCEPSADLRQTLLALPSLSQLSMLSIAGDQDLAILDLSTLASVKVVYPLCTLHAFHS